MNVITEATPNPATLKFIPGCPVMEEGTVNFASADMAARVPLARRLFAIDGVKGVFFGADFVSVAKSEAVDWRALEQSVFAVIEAHFESGDPIGLVHEGPGADEDEKDDAVVRQIKELLETRIRPSVALDGGDIVYRGFERGVVYLSLQGACIGCPSSSATLKMGVENLLKHYVPAVLRVEPID
ncbi:MAG: NifU family protein [Rhodospirillaceae bacterium]|nr:NifU family protein [Rhodospirillaceae bacterium]